MGLIYLDACLLIYAVEEHPDHAPRVRARLETAAAADKRFAISPLVTLECLVKPIRDANTALERRYRQAFDTFEMLPMSAEVFEQAATLRGRFGTRTPDALHLPCAQVHRCTAASIY